MVQNAPPAEMCRKEETTLKRSNRSRNGHCHGSTAFGVVGFCGGAAGDASRHAAVIYCGTASPSGLPMWNGIPASDNRCVGAGDVSEFYFLDADCTDDADK